MTTAPTAQVDLGVRTDVNSHLTPNRPTNTPSGRRPGALRRRREDVENDTYLVFVARVIKAAGKRIGQGDVDSLPDLAALTADLDTALITAVKGLREFGYSWEQIASRLGVTRQAAQQRWGQA